MGKIIKVRIYSELNLEIDGEGFNDPTEALDAAYTQEEMGSMLIDNWSVEFEEKEDGQ